MRFRSTCPGAHPKYRKSPATRQSVELPFLGDQGHRISGLHKLWLSSSFADLLIINARILREKWRWHNIAPRNAKLDRLGRLWKERLNAVESASAVRLISNRRN